MCVKLTTDNLNKIYTQWKEISAITNFFTRQSWVKRFQFDNFVYYSHTCDDHLHRKSTRKKKSTFRGMIYCSRSTKNEEHRYKFCSYKLGRTINVRFYISLVNNAKWFGFLYKKSRLKSIIGTLNSLLI